MKTFNKRQLLGYSFWTMNGQAFGKQLRHHSRFVLGIWESGTMIPPSTPPEGVCPGNYYLWVSHCVFSTSPFEIEPQRYLSTCTYGQFCHPRTTGSLSTAHWRPVHSGNRRCGEIKCNEINEKDNSNHSLLRPFLPRNRILKFQNTHASFFSIQTWILEHSHRKMK